MKKMFLILVVVVMLAVFQTQAHATFRWQNLGRAPLMGQITDVLALQEAFPSYEEDVIQGLGLAQPQWNVRKMTGLIASAIKSGQIVEDVLPSGTGFSWMVFRPSTGITAVRDVVWAGQEDLYGFVVPVRYGRQNLYFFIAAGCGNLTLLEAMAAEEQPAAPQAGRVERFERVAGVIIGIIRALPPPPPGVVVQERGYYCGPPHYRRGHGHYFGHRCGHEKRCRPYPKPPKSPKPHCPYSGSPGGR